MRLCLTKEGLSRHPPDCHLYIEEPLQSESLFLWVISMNMQSLEWYQVMTCNHTVQRPQSICK